MSGVDLRPSVPDRVRQTWLAWVGLALLAVVAGGAVVAQRATDSTALWWAFLAGVVVVSLLGYVRVLLDRNGPVDADGRASATAARYPTFGVANALTTGRGLLLAPLAGLFVLPDPGWLPALLYGAVVLLDVLDGAVARARDRTSVLGTRLDTAVDAAGLLVAGGLGVALGTLPVWFLAVGAARYCYVAGLWWRRRRGLPVGTLPSSRVRRPLAALQMVVTAVALAPVVGPPVTTLVATAAMVPFVVGFCRDYRAVTSRDVKRTAAQGTV